MCVKKNVAAELRPVTFDTSRLIPIWLLQMQIVHKSNHTGSRQTALARKARQLLTSRALFLFIHL